MARSGRWAAMGGGGRKALPGIVVSSRVTGWRKWMKVVGRGRLKQEKYRTSTDRVRQENDLCCHHAPSTHGPPARGKARLAWFKELEQETNAANCQMNNRWGFSQKEKLGRLVVHCGPRS